jgi:hypothetical protein
VERGIPMKFRLPAFVSIAVLFLSPGAAVAERTVVLLTNEDCPVTELSNLEIRKAYLGIAVVSEGQQIRPIRLIADQDLNRIFFQTIVAMSEKSYERRALSLTMKFGTPRPVELSNLEEVVATLRQSTCSVAFLWADDASTISNTKIVRVLWRG